MSAIVTDFFKIKNAKDFVASTATKSMYVALGKFTPWAVDISPPLPTTAYNEIVYSFGEEAYAAKRITSADAIHVIPRNNWETGDLTYVAYNPNDQLLFTKKFYTVSNDAGEFKVYKLIVKGAGATTVQPVHTTSTIPAPGADGYAWKYMYNIPTDVYVKFATSFHVPVVNIVGNVDATAGGGATPVPIGGHGFDNIEELGAYSVSVNVRFEFDEGGILPVTNDFRKVAIIENPFIFNGTPGSTVGGNPAAGTVATATVINMATLFNMSAVGGVFLSDETITGPNGTGKVIGFDQLSNKLHVKLMTGFFTAADTITGGSSAATGTIGSIVAPGIQMYSGDTIYIENRGPVSRAGDQTESITTVIEF